ncbi:MAG: hypothetical protein U0R26_11725 [Solirubrobacterales bacterium]
MKVLTRLEPVRIVSCSFAGRAPTLTWIRLIRPLPTSAVGCSRLK